jgi:hypothetical protein
LSGGSVGGQNLYVIDLGSQRLVEVWFTEDAKAHDTQFLDGQRPAQGQRLLTRATANQRESQPAISVLRETFSKS